MHILIATFILSLFSFPAFAQTPPCTGASDEGNSYETCASGVCERMICDGSSFVAQYIQDASGTYNIDFGNDTSTCNSGRAGRLRYDGSSTWEYCNGSAWTNLFSGAAVDTIQDADGNTLVQVEKSANENVIRFDTNGTERLTIGNTGTVTGTGQFITTSSDAYRVVSGGYGGFIRMDGANYYILLTDNADAYGSWNSLRPFRINLSTGDVYLGTNAFYVEHSGDVSVGHTSPAAKLDVNGTLRVRTATQDDALTKIAALDADGDLGWRDSSTLGSLVPSDIKNTTSSASDGDFGGYDGMQSWIESNGCSGYTVCTGVDIARYIAAGNSPPSTGRFMTGTSFEGATSTSNDCDGWTSSSSSRSSQLWYVQASNNRATTSDCGNSHTVVCCQW